MQFHSLLSRLGSSDCCHLLAHSKYTIRQLQFCISFAVNEELTVRVSGLHKPCNFSPAFCALASDLSFHKCLFSNHLFIRICIMGCCRIGNTRKCPDLPLIKFSNAF